MQKKILSLKQNQKEFLVEVIKEKKDIKQKIKKIMIKNYLNKLLINGKKMHLLYQKKIY